MYWHIFALYWQKLQLHTYESNTFWHGTGKSCPCIIRFIVKISKKFKMKLYIYNKINSQQIYK